MSITQFQNAIELLDHAFLTYKDMPAYTCLGATLSFREVDELSAQFASYLQRHTNLKPGDRIAIQLPNILQYPIVLYGALRAGLIIVNTNPLYTSREIAHQLNDSGAKVLVVLANVAAEAAEIVDQTQVEQVLVTELGDLMPWPKRSLVNFVVKHVKKMVPAFSFRHQVAFRDALALGTSLPYEKVSVQNDDLIALQYTGGTTGVAKGAMLSHNNICSNIFQTLQHLHPILSAEAEDCLLYTSPSPRDLSTSRMPSSA